jgi:hypothetical protein
METLQRYAFSGENKKTDKEYLIKMFDEFGIQYEIEKSAIIIARHFLTQKKIEAVGIDHIVFEFNEFGEFTKLLIEE